LREGLIRQQPGAIDVNEAAVDAGAVAEESDGATSSPSSGEDSAGAGTGGETLDADAVASPTETVTNAGGTDGSADVTGTNVQEVGVDEQDRMKSDGEFLYILENQYSDFATEDEILAMEQGGFPDSPAANDPSMQGDGSEANFTIELLPVTPVDTGATSVLPPEQVITKIRILAMKNEVPDAQPVADLQLNLNGGATDGMYLFKDDSKSNLILTSTSFDNYLYEWDYSYAFSHASSILTKLDVTDPTQASLGQSLKIDGQIISSRRIDDKLFVASRYYPAIADIDPYSMTPEEYENAIQQADLTRLLPKITLNDGTVTDLVNPEECFVAAQQSQDYYYTPDIVSLSVFDLKTMGLKDSECFLGSSEALYATPNSVYLATTRWDDGVYPEFEITEDGLQTTYVDPRVDTDIHQFAIDGSELNYSGSGVVPGHLGWNPTRKPFRMSEKGEYLRVATYSEAQNESVSPVRLSVLNVAGDGELKKVAELPNANNPEHIAKPGEQLYASRFLGNRAYLVTFRQTDPLYIIDLSNPTDPKLAGELEIDGYSDYLQPIGEDHLLGIGKDAVPGPVEWEEGALTQGIKLSLFNIADASNPTEVQSIVIGERGSEAEALSNHRAITIQRATDTRPTRVAFGIDVHGLANPRPASSDPSIWYPWNFSALHGFDINVGSGAGIEQRGAMIVNSASNPRPIGFGFGNDRSVIVGDSVYYIHKSEVFAATWSDLGNFRGPR